MCVVIHIPVGAVTVNKKLTPYPVGLVYGPQLDVGGVETHLLQLLKYLDRDAFDPVLFSGASERFTGQAGSLGSKVIPWEPESALDFRSAHHLQKLFREEKIDLVHIHHPRAYWPASQAARALGLPCAATVHLLAREMAEAPVPFRSFKRWAYGAMEGWLLRQRIDQVIFVSENARSRMGPVSRAVTIPNGIDLRPVQQNSRETLRAALCAPKESVVVVGVGRLHPQKGYDVLLEALALLQPAPETLRLWIVGDGEEHAALEAQTRALNLQDTVQFLGAREDIPDLLRAADIFVLPSRFEGMPYILLEAMAAGMAIIASEVGEVGNIIEENKTGFLVPSGAPAGLAKRIKTLSQSPKIRKEFGAAARAKTGNYEAEPMVRRLTGVYKSLLQFDSAEVHGVRNG